MSMPCHDRQNLRYLLKNHRIDQSRKILLHDLLLRQQDRHHVNFYSQPFVELTFFTFENKNWSKHIQNVLFSIVCFLFIVCYLRPRPQAGSRWGSTPMPPHDSDCQAKGNEGGWWSIYELKFLLYNFQPWLKQNDF